MYNIHVAICRSLTAVRSDIVKTQLFNEQDQDRDQDSTRNSAIADKPARRVYRSVKVTKHSTIPYARYTLCPKKNGGPEL